MKFVQKSESGITWKSLIKKICQRCSSSLFFSKNVKKPSYFHSFRRHGFRSYSFFQVSVCTLFCHSRWMKKKKNLELKKILVYLYRYVFICTSAIIKVQQNIHTQVNISLRSINLYKHEDRNIDTDALDECVA